MITKSYNLQEFDAEKTLEVVCPNADEIIVPEQPMKVRVKIYQSISGAEIP